MNRARQRPISAAASSNKRPFCSPNMATHKPAIFLLLYVLTAYAVARPAEGDPAWGGYFHLAAKA